MMPSYFQRWVNSRTEGCSDHLRRIVTEAQAIVDAALAVGKSGELVTSLKFDPGAEGSLWEFEKRFPARADGFSFDVRGLQEN